MTPDKEKLMHLERIADALERIADYLDDGDIDDGDVTENLPPNDLPPAPSAPATWQKLGFSCAFCQQWVYPNTAHNCPGVIQPTTNGWRCSKCGTWVVNSFHSCWTVGGNGTFGSGVTVSYNHGSNSS